MCVCVRARVCVCVCVCCVCSLYPCSVRAVTQVPLATKVSTKETFLHVRSVIDQFSQSLIYLFLDLMRYINNHFEKSLNSDVSFVWEVESY